MTAPTPTVPEGTDAEPVVALTLVLPLATAARVAEFAARRSLPFGRVVEMLIDFAHLGRDGSLSVGPLTVGTPEQDPQLPGWARSALADRKVMSGRRAYPVMVLPGCRSTDHARPATGRAGPG